MVNKKKLYKTVVFLIRFLDKQYVRTLKKYVKKYLIAEFCETRQKRQIKKLSNDPIRSNAQIFVNIQNWLYRNMLECPQAQRHYEKLSVSTFLLNFDDLLLLISNLDRYRFLGLKIETCNYDTFFIYKGLVILVL